MLHRCLGCGARYAAPLAACPQCGGTSYAPDWEEDGMAKIGSTGEATGHLPVPGAPGTETAGGGAPDAVPEVPQETAEPEGGDEQEAPAGEDGGAGDAAADEAGAAKPARNGKTAPPKAPPKASPKAPG